MADPRRPPWGGPRALLRWRVCLPARPRHVSGRRLAQAVLARPWEASVQGPGSSAWAARPRPQDGQGLQHLPRLPCPAAKGNLTLSFPSSLGGCAPMRGWLFWGLHSQPGIKPSTQIQTTLPSAHGHTPRLSWRPAAFISKRGHGQAHRQTQVQKQTKPGAAAPAAHGQSAPVSVQFRLR